MARPVRFTMNAVGVSPWQVVNYHESPVNLAINVAILAGTATYNVEYTYDRVDNVPDPSGAVPFTPNPTPIVDPLLNGATASGETTFSFPITAWRVNVTAAAGLSMAVTGIQAGIEE